LPWDAAFAAVTRTPAEIFGVGNRIGRLERNYLADVVVWDGDPLEVQSAPTMVFIEGQEQPLTSRQTLLRDRYRPERLGQR
jgi:imidazolonepropionase-like amidohydrolase